MVGREILSSIAARYARTRIRSERNIPPGGVSALCVAHECAPPTTHECERTRSHVPENARSRPRASGPARFSRTHGHSQQSVSVRLLVQPGA